jgi:hypothetical protein
MTMNQFKRLTELDLRMKASCDVEDGIRLQVEV